MKKQRGKPGGQPAGRRSDVARGAASGSAAGRGVRPEGAPTRRRSLRATVIGVVALLALIVGAWQAYPRLASPTSSPEARRTPRTGGNTSTPASVPLAPVTSSAAQPPPSQGGTEPSGPSSGLPAIPPAGAVGAPTGETTAPPAVTLASLTGEAVEKSFPAAGIRRIKVSVRMGDLHVRADHPAGVHVQGRWEFYHLSPGSIRLWARKAAVAFERQGETLIVRDAVPDAILNEIGGNHPRLRLEIQAPPRLALELNTAYGDAEVSGEVGDLLTEASIGNVRLQGVRCTGERAAAKTSVGNATLALEKLPRTELRAEVGVGNASVALPSRAEATVSATATVGRVTSRLPLTATRRTGMVVGETLTGMLNGGGPSVEVQVSTGDAELAPATPAGR